MYDGAKKGHLRGRFEITRLQEEKDAENGESAHDEDHQQEEQPSGGVVPQHAVADSGDHVRCMPL